MRKTFFVAIVISVLSLIATSLGCSKTSSTISTTSSSSPTMTKPTASPTPVEPIKIGALESVTGPYGPYGSTFLAGQKLAIQMVNDAGGIKSLGGAKIVAAFGSGDSTAITAASEVERLIASENVVAITGPTATAETLAVVPITERYKVPLVQAAQDDTLYQKGYRYLFGIAPSATTVGKQIAEFINWLAKNYGAPTDRMAFAFVTPSYQAYMDAAIARLAEMGYSNIVLKESFPATVTDQTPLVLKLKAANATMVVYLGVQTDSISFLKTSYNFDYTPWLVAGAPSFAQPAIRDALPADIAKKVLARPNAFSAFINLLTDAYWNIPSAKAFQDVFDKAYPNSTMDRTLVANGAMKVFSLARAIDNAGSRNRDDIAAALRKLVIKAPDPYLVWLELYPELKMGDNGLTVGGSIQAVQWADDLSRTQLIWPESVALAKPRVQK